MHRWKFIINIFETASGEPTKYMAYVTAPTIADAMEIVKIKMVGVVHFTDAEWLEEWNPSHIKNYSRYIRISKPPDVISITEKPV